MRITAVNRAARGGGVRAGMMLSDGRALIPGLRVGRARPRADLHALDGLAAWCGRYTPWCARDGNDGIWLDITGCAHLFGGEAALAGDLAGRFADFGITVRAAAADTPGAAWAVARHGGREGEGGREGDGGGSVRIVAPGGARAALAALPVTALRLADETAAGLMRLGLRRIGDLYDLPRAPLARRFGAALVRRLDQALGDEDEPISPDAPVIPYRARISFAEPIGRREDVDAALGRLLDELALLLERDSRGARRLELMVYRVDGTTGGVAIGTSRPMRDRGHLARLFAERLDRIEAGFGIEAMMLSAPATDLLPAAQLALRHIRARLNGGGDDDDAALARLVDRLGTRLGDENVALLEPRASHIPERATAIVPAAAPGSDHIHEPGEWRHGGGGGRPIRLLVRPEPVEVMAEVPEGPPLLFRWRRAAYRVAVARGPERIAPEWWRDGGAAVRTRDYYRVEDTEGRRFWLYRDGLYRDGGGGHGGESGPEWYLHGIFA